MTIKGVSLCCDVPYFLKALTPNAMAREVLRKRSLNKIPDLQGGVMSICSANSQRCVGGVRDFCNCMHYCLVTIAL